MGLFLLIAFIATPIVEIALFIEVGDHFGLWPTLAAVVLTAIIGTALLRWQGVATWTRASQSLQRGVFPVNEVFAGLCLVAAGALLLTPGFLTDTIGFLIFLPPIRVLLARLIKRAVERRNGHKVWINGEGVDPSGQHGDIIDGEYKLSGQATPPPASLDQRPSPPNDNSPWRKEP
jgi:UPF0716 protein FxsA